jgi:hypothetical protein
MFYAGQGKAASHSRQGGLTKALQSSVTSRGVGANVVAQEGPSVAHPTAGNAPATSPLGRSPSRNFVTANHLLNFQYDRSRVSFYNQ